MPDFNIDEKEELPNETFPFEVKYNNLYIDKNKFKSE